MNETCVPDAATTAAAEVAPIRTRTPAGMAVPVTVTTVPPALATRVGLIEVSPKAPVPG